MLASSTGDGDSDACSWDSALVADDDATAAGAQPHRSGVQPPGPGDAAGVAELAAGVPAEAEEAQPRAGASSSATRAESQLPASESPSVELASIHPSRGPRQTCCAKQAHARAARSYAMPSSCPRQSGTHKAMRNALLVAARAKFYGKLFKHKGI